MGKPKKVKLKYSKRAEQIKHEKLVAELEELSQMVIRLRERIDYREADVF